MADGLIQKTEDREQRTELLSRRSRAFNKRAAQRHTNICLLSSDGTTDETTSHSTRLPKNSGQVAGYVFCLLMSVLCPLNAEELPDPTRPPASLAAPIAAPAGGAAANEPAGLQSIIISKTRRAAIIDGETVELGGKYGDAKLIEVNEGNVVLRSAQGRQVISLFPDVKITGKQETKIKPRLPANEAQSGKQKNGPAAHKERK